MCREYHIYGKHTRSRADSFKRDIAAGMHKNHMQSASKCHRCNREVRDTAQTCGACGQVGKPGERLHCYDHCVDFMKADADVRLQQVLRHGDCTYCLLRDHDTDSHISRAAGNPEMLQACGILDKSNNTKCPSNQNSAFHGAAGHKQQVQKGFHTRNKLGVPQESKGVRDSGQATIRKEWEKSARRSRAEEMEEARLLLQQPEVDGDQVLLLIHEVTLVAGKDRREVKATLFNDKGSTCTMISRRMVKQLELESISKSVIVQSFGHSDTIKTEFVVLEILTAQAELKLVRAYIVDSITNMAKVEIPEELKEAFQK